MNDEQVKFLKIMIKEAEDNDHIATSLELLERYIALGSASSYYLFQYGENLRVVGRCEEAERVLINIGNAPEDKKWRIELQLAKLYSETGRMKEAEDRYKNAVLLNPMTTTTWVLYGNLLLRLGRFREAIDILTKGLAATGLLEEVHINLGDCFCALRDYSSARDHYLRAKAIDPDYTGLKKKLEDVGSALTVIESS
jgi:tetratricopeptide (TPR) repeat protein